MGAMGKAISTMYPELDVSLFPGGGLANVMHVEKGASDFGIAAHSVIFAAAKGIDPYKKPTENVMGLLNLHDSTRMHFIVNKASGITSLAQIKEKKMPIRISMSHTAGNSYLFGKWILEEYGISQQDITAWGGKIYTPSTNDAASMMKDGQLDVALWIGPGEAFIVQDMMNSVDLDILPVDENVIKAVGDPGVVLRRQVRQGHRHRIRQHRTHDQQERLRGHRLQDGQGHVRKARRHRDRQPVLEILHAREGGSGARSAAASRRGKILQGKRLAVEN